MHSAVRSSVFGLEERFRRRLGRGCWPVVAEKQRLARSGAQWFLPAPRAGRQARRLALRVAGSSGLDVVVTRGLVGRSGSDIHALATR